MFVEGEESLFKLETLALGHGEVGLWCWRLHMSFPHSNVTLNNWEHLLHPWIHPFILQTIPTWEILYGLGLRVLL